MLQVAKPILGRLAQGARLEEVFPAAEESAANTDFPGLTLPIPPDAGISGFICATKGRVAAVFGACCLAKIAQPIVVFDSVDMVYFVNRHGPVGVEPCNPMQEVETVLNPNAEIPMAREASRNITNSNAAIRATQVDKNACLWTIVQKGFQIFLRDFHAYSSTFGIGARQFTAAVSRHFTTVAGGRVA